MDSGGFVPLQAGGLDIPFLLMMTSIFLIFYFLVIRPQQKQQREREAFLKTAARGDDVVTTGGIHGKVSAVDGEVLEVEVARLKGEKIKLRVSRNRIDQLTKAGAGEASGASGSASGSKGEEA
ncbi:MAG: preprotein translocase subunit YajC [Myxococcota bacterium]